MNMEADRHHGASRRRWSAAVALALVVAVVAILVQALAGRPMQPSLPAPIAADIDAAPRPEAAPETTTLASAEESAPLRVRAARSQVGVTRHYDPTYVTLAYPGGDVPIERGVCTDVVIRALRHEGLDLQQAVHEDMRAHFAAYPALWGLRGPDRNIDHRRVPNLRRWFERQGWALQAGSEPADYHPGDLVTWTLPGGLPHIGVVSERHSPAGVPLIIHNIGHGTREEDVLFAYTMTGHYRPRH